MSNQDPDIFNKVDTDEVGDVDDDSYIPPDQPMGSHAFGTTAAEERSGETYEQRDRHTLPEVDEDIEEDQQLVGRLVQDGDNDIDDVDDETNAIAVDQGMDDDMSAEERAMHVTDL